MLRAIFILVITASSSIAAVDFAVEVQPILVNHCLKCHRKDYKKSDYRLETRTDALTEGIIIPGDPGKSPFIELLNLDDDDDDVMPPAKEERLTTGQKKNPRGLGAAGSRVAGWDHPENARRSRFQA
ncbi:MAG: c-type cytochrome domain-containing protein [Verrucomicrobiales bacterium]